MESFFLEVLNRLGTGAKKVGYELKNRKFANGRFTIGRTVEEIVRFRFDFRSSRIACVLCWTSIVNISGDDRGCRMVCSRHAMREAELTMGTIMESCRDGASCS
jgi:hypothetical protein